MPPLPDQRVYVRDENMPRMAHPVPSDARILRKGAAACQVEAKGGWERTERTVVSVSTARPMLETLMPCGPRAVRQTEIGGLSTECNQGYT